MNRIYILLLLALSGSLPRLGEAADCNPTVILDGNAQQGLHDAAATPLQVQFDSGASWNLCWHIDPSVGLVVSRVFYAAPAEQSRQVLDAGSLGQILFRYDGDINHRHLLSETGLGGQQIVEPESTDCLDGEIVSGVDGSQVCQRIRQINHLIKVRNSRSVRRHELSLHAWSTIGTHRFQQIWRFSEDGEIAPSVVFSGNINHYTDDARYGVELDSSRQFAASASMLFNWRLDFNINSTPTNDRVDEIEFPAVVTDVVKREISVQNLSVETLRNVDRESFRGWRISDAEQSSGTQNGASATTRIGYYLDPQTVAYRYTRDTDTWAYHDFAVTARHNCELLASGNERIVGGCADSLDDYNDGENLENTDTVVWFSISRHFTPRLEDHPAIVAVETGFKIIPFDWSAHTPFSPPDEPQTNSSVSAASGASVEQVIPE